MISFRKIRRGKNEKIKKRTPRVSGFSKSIGKGNWSEERKKKCMNETLWCFAWLLFNVVIEIVLSFFFFYVFLKSLTRRANICSFSRKHLWQQIQMLELVVENWRESNFRNIAPTTFHYLSWIECAKRKSKFVVISNGYASAIPENINFAIHLK